MADEATSTTDDAAVQTSDDSASTEDSATETSSTEQEASESSKGDESKLGDAGKKALDAMKAERNKYRDDMKSLREEFEAFKAKAEGKEAEFTAAQEAQRVKDEALAAANAKIRNAEVKAAAKGVLADPSDALTFLDLDSIEVSEDGDVDADAVKAALDKLIETKPYLAVQDGKRFQGDADAGTRKESRPAQLNEAEVKRLYAEGKHDEIVKAESEGRLADYLKS